METAPEMVKAANWRRDAVSPEAQAVPLVGGRGRGGRPLRRFMGREAVIEPLKLLPPVGVA